MVVAPEDADAFIAAAEQENLEAYRVAVVTESPRMVMRWTGPDHRGSVPGIPEHQRRGEARRRLRGPAAPPQLGPAPRLPCTCGEMAGQPEMRLPPGPRRALRRHHRRRQRADALRRQVPAHPRPGHGRPAAGAARAAHGPGQRHGLGLRPGRDVARTPIAGAYQCRGQSPLPSWWPPARTTGRPISPSRSSLRSCGTSPDRWGKPFAALLGALDAQLELGRGRHRRQGLHVRLLPGPGRAPHPDLLCHRPRQGRARCCPRSSRQAGHPVYLFRRRTAPEEPAGSLGALPPAVPGRARSRPPGPWSTAAGRGPS